MKKEKVDKFYVSPDTKFLNEFDEKHPEKSNSQLEKIKKHARIALLRDDPNVVEEEKLWEGF